MAHKERLLARTWPNGDGCLWHEVKRLELRRDPDEATPIGLSIVPSFNSEQDGPTEVRRLQRRGLNGITRFGRNMVRSGAQLLEEAYGKDCLSFVTLTIPGNAAETSEVSRGWGKVCNRFMVALRRRLASGGLPDYVIGVTEVQEVRFLRDGGMPLHLHLVIVGRRSPRSRWVISADELREIWRRSVEAQIGSRGEQVFRASVDVQKVRKSAAAYLGKYLSKGSGAVQAIREANPELLDLLPGQWWVSTDAMREAVKHHTAYGERHAEAICSMMQSRRSELFFRWIAVVPLLDCSGGVITSVTLYSLTLRGRELLGLDRPTRGYFSYPEPTLVSL